LNFVVCSFRKCDLNAAFSIEVTLPHVSQIANDLHPFPLADLALFCILFKLHNPCKSLAFWWSWMTLEMLLKIVFTVVLYLGYVDPNTECP